MKAKFLVAALVAAFAISAVSASAAQAEAVGPFWRTSCHKVSAANKGLGAFGEASCLTGGGSKEWDTRLLAGEESAVTAKASKSYVFHIGVAWTITCTKQAIEGGKLIGSSGASSGALRGTPTFEGCTVTGGGEGCQLLGNAIRFETAEYQLGYERLTEARQRRGKLLMLLKPRQGEIFGRLETNGNCHFPNDQFLQGSIVVEVLSGGKAVEVGAEPAAGKALELGFPSTKITTIWTEQNGVLTEVKPALSISFGNVRLEGKEEIGLQSGGVFGAFTQWSRRF